MARVDRMAEAINTPLGLLVSLTQDRCLARLGPGARVVALIAAAHARRVALIWPA
jgi:hypothetical protein